MGPTVGPSYPPHQPAAKAETAKSSHLYESSKLRNDSKESLSAQKSLVSITTGVFRERFLSPIETAALSVSPSRSHKRRWPLRGGL